MVNLGILGKGVKKLFLSFLKFHYLGRNEVTFLLVETRSKFDAENEGGST